ncbi:MAG: hypothetical protein RL347_1916 [Actinomycetota bacterium]
MTSARIALITASCAYAAAVLIAIAAVPWDGAVAPWADLQGSMISAFTSEQIATIEAYVASAWLPGVLGLIAGPLAVVAIALSPAARCRITAIGSSRQPGHALRSAAGDLIVATTVLAIVRLATLPFAAWSAQVRRDAGLLIDPWGTWWLRWLGESATYVIVGALALTLALLILRRWPRRGWIAVTAGAGLAAIVVTAGLPFLQRVEGTTADPELTARVQAVADRAGVDVGAVTVIAVGDTTPAINANVSGWGPTRTVTVYDTVTTTLTDAELDALIAHELIHVRQGDAVLGAILAVLAAIGTAAFVSALLLSVRVRRWLGASSPGDPRVVPLVVATFLVASLAATAVGASISRPLESRADREAIALTGDPQAYQSLIQVLAVTNRSTLTPAQWRYALLFTHPTPLQRLAALTPG